MQYNPYIILIYKWKNKHLKTEKKLIAMPQAIFPLRHGKYAKLSLCQKPIKNTLVVDSFWIYYCFIAQAGKVSRI